jgi:hypothetical protein
MERDDLLRLLQIIAEQQNGDPEIAHSNADQALLDYINDEEVTVAYEAIEKWYGAAG